MRPRKNSGWNSGPQMPMKLLRELDAVHGTTHGAKKGAPSRKERRKQERMMKSRPKYQMHEKHTDVVHASVSEGMEQQLSGAKRALGRKEDQEEEIKQRRQDLKSSGNGSEVKGKNKDRNAKRVRRSTKFDELVPESAKIKVGFMMARCLGSCGSCPLTHSWNDVMCHCIYYCRWE